MSPRKTYYEFLRVSRQATPDEIDDKFRALARQYRAGNGAQKPEVENLWRQISQAYTVLHDPVRRAEYDRTLSRITPPAVPAAPPASPPAPAAPPPAPAPRRSPPRSPLESPAMNRLLRQAEGDALAEAGQWEEALAAYQGALGRQPDPRLQAKIAQMEQQVARRNGPAPQPRMPESEEASAPEKPSLWRRLLGRAGADG